jgi:oxygen-dependent protoporphyrinogen oxidase
MKRVLEFFGDRTFTDYVGDVPADVRALFRCTVTRASGDIDEQSAGFSLGIFHSVWDRKHGLGRNIFGGSGTVVERVHGELSDQTVTQARVTEISPTPSGVRVAYDHPANGPQQVDARYAIVATQAPVARQVIRELPANVDRALSAIRYGKTIIVSFLTNETGPQWWDDVYAIATPERSTSMVFNMANVRRGAELKREPGGSLMAYSMAGLADPMLALSDDEVVETYVRELDESFPGFAKIIDEAKVQRWPSALPYPFPGRAELQADLLTPLGRIFLAGDYLGVPTTDTAVETGRLAAQEILSSLTGPQETPTPPVAVSGSRQA